MDADRWQQVETLFHHTRELPGHESQAILDSLRPQDASLVEQVEAMLGAHRESGAQLGGIVQSAITGALEQLPESIGPYEVVSRIGIGGFSSVYLARPTDAGPSTDSSRQVAIKVLRRGSATADARQRLVQESEILARLHHPNIARFLGHGTGRFGEPYFVMEWVEGEPIDRFCDQRRLTIDERLKLFRQACSAVDYAHRNLVIHRDIKPSNLLVTRDGVPKLLDFGIAKLMLPDLLRTEPVHTMAGGSPMTPDFASPEQVREEPLTTATDVYSLGVLLYRLLCGRPPYRFGTRSPRAIEEVISTVEPAPPSDGLMIQAKSGQSDGAADAEDLAQLRQTSVSQLRGRLQGDLDSIVLMALSKEPEQRYSSVQQLARDIGHHLSSLPVTARRITPGYRLRKFIRRHMLGVSIAGAFVLTLITAVVVTTRATWRAEAQQARAERHLAEARLVTDFLVDIFEDPDPETAQGRKVEARQLLDEGARRIGRLDHQPEIQSSLMVTMGRVYSNLGEHQKARQLLTEALELRRQENIVSQSAIIENLQLLARSLMVQGELDSALKLLTQARSTLDAANLNTTPVYAHILTLMAETKKQQSLLEESEVLFLQALELQQAKLAPDDPDLVDTLAGMAELWALKRDLGKAEATFRRTLELRRSRLGNTHPDVAVSLGNLAVVLHGQERFEEAERLVREAIRIRALLYGEQHWIVGKSYNNLGQTLAAQGKLEEALTWMEKALEIGRAELGPDHRLIASRSVNLARIYLKAGRPDEAEELYLQALKTHRDSLGEDHPATARNLFLLAQLYSNQERETEALELVDRAIAGMRTVLLKDDYRLSHPLLLRGSLLARRGECSTALPALEQALAIRRQKHPDDHSRVVAVLSEIARCDGSQG